MKLIRGRRRCAFAVKRSRWCGTSLSFPARSADYLPCWAGNSFAPRVSHHSIPSFEEQIVFARDVELCLSRLSDDHAEIITLVGLYDFSLDEVAELLRYSRAAVHRWFLEALDYLSEVFLRSGLLLEEHPDRRQRQVAARSLPNDVAAMGKKPPRSVKVAPVRQSPAPLAHSAISRCDRSRPERPVRGGDSQRP